MEYSHDTYISPLTWRYGSKEMKEIFSETHKRKLLRRVWIALARAESEAGIVTPEQVKELEAHKDDVDIDRATEIENVIHHDLMAEIKTYAEQCPKAGGIIHLGATSMDALDNADALRFREALDIIIEKTGVLIEELAGRAEEGKDTATMAFTHIQPAEITTIGYRLSQTLQDLAEDAEELLRVRDSIRGKGMKGAVGTSASYSVLLSGTGISAMELEQMVMDELGIDKPLQLLEYACICARTRFKLIHFERMVNITKEWNTMEFLKNQEEKPVMLKANKLRLMALVMPLRKDRIKIYDK